MLQLPNGKIKANCSMSFSFKSLFRLIVMFIFYSVVFVVINAYYYS